MTECGRCGANASGRYCSACGASLAGAPAGGPFLFDVGDSSVPERAVVVKTGPSRPTLPLVVASAVLVALLMWVITRSPEAADPDQEPALVADENPTSAQPEPSVAFAETTTTTTAPSASAEAAMITEGDAGEYWLGEASGWYVLVRTTDGLVRIDLGTGEQVNMGLDLSPVLYTGNHVVLRSSRGEFTVLEPSELAGEPFTAAVEPLTGSYGSSGRISVSDDPNKMWIEHAFDGHGATEVDLSTGAELRVSGPDLEAYGWGTSTPQFTSPSSGGVYRLSAKGTYELLRSGFVVAEGFGRMLVTNCDFQLKCRMTWLDSASFEPLSELVAPADTAQWRAFLLANGRVVGTNPTDFIDVETGESIRIQATEMDGVWRGSTAISPDAKALLATGGGTPYVRGVRTGVVRELADLGVAQSVAPVFIPKETTEAP